MNELQRKFNELEQTHFDLEIRYEQAEVFDIFNL